MNIEYAVQIIWSKEDGAYIAATAELPGCVADGQTQNEALANLKEVIKEWLEVAKEEGRTIPRPMTQEDLEKLHKVAATQLRQQIENQVQQSLDTVLQQLSQLSQQFGHQHGTAAFGWRAGMVSDPSAEELVTKRR